MLQSVTEYYSVLKSITGYYRVLQSVVEYCIVLQSVTECYRMIQYVTECYKILQSVTKCYRVLQNITKYYRVFLAHLLGPIFWWRVLIGFRWCDKFTKLMEYELRLIDHIDVTMISSPSSLRGPLLGSSSCIQFIFA